MSSIKRLSGILLGDFGPPEFAAARELLRRDVLVTEVPDVASLFKALRKDDAAELVVVAQEQPRQWDGAWLDELRRAAPLVRVVAIVGTWCEGETRTGVPLAADVRIHWHRFGAWWSRQMNLVAHGHAPDWSGRVDLNPPYHDYGFHGSNRLSQDKVAAPSKSKGLVLIAAEDRESAESIALACEFGGWAGVWVRASAPLPLVRGATSIVFDGGQLDEPDLAVIRQLQDRYGPLPVIALSDFPTIDRCRAAQSVGVHSVLGKPFDVRDLLAELENESRISNMEHRASK